MSSVPSLTKRQWISLLVLLALNLVCIYGGAIPLAVTFIFHPASFQSTTEVSPMELALESEPSPASTPAPAPRPKSPPSPTAARTPTFAPTASRPTTSSLTPIRRPPTRAASTVPLQLSAARAISPSALARLELDPKSMLASKTTFFTSACFGQDANLRQDRDYMAPADWSSSPDRKCIFGFEVNPANGLPIGRYSVFGGPDGQPRFYIVPPEAFASDQQRIKQLSQMHLIVDVDQGCDALGFLGITADGVNYQCPACAFPSSGGICPSTDGSKSIVLPANRAYALDPRETGGAHGFQGFPLVLFRKGFSLYFTGKAGGPPPRIWFESGIDTLLPGVRVKTTAEMNSREIREIASAFDGAFSTTDPIRQLSPLEHEAQLISASPVRVRSKERTIMAFATTPGSILSSVSWRIRPLNNVFAPAYLETNICLDVGGDEACFTGVEDFAHCAFYMTCRTGFSSLVDNGGGEYVATRYFIPGAAPILHDGRLSVKFQGPDIGTVLEMDVKVRVRNAGTTVALK